MLVKMRAILASPKYQAKIGEVIDLPENMAISLIENGSAELVEVKTKKIDVEQATIIPPENEIVKPEPKVKKGKRKG